MKSIFVDINEFSFDPIHSSYVEKKFLQPNQQTTNARPSQYQTSILNNQSNQNNQLDLPMETSIALSTFSQDKNGNQEKEQETKENIGELEQSCSAQELYTFEAKFINSLNSKYLKKESI